MNTYVALKNQIFQKGNLKIIPIRYSDRYKIMRWRNSQIYHLRQKKILTKSDQDDYFNNIIVQLFKEVFK